MSDRIIEIDEDGKVTALPDFTTDRAALCERIIELEKERTEWQMIANDHIIAVRTITSQLQSMHDAWEEMSNKLIHYKWSPQKRSASSHDNGYAGALIQAATEVSGLLKAIREWPERTRPHV